MVTLTFIKSKTFIGAYDIYIGGKFFVGGSEKNDVFKVFVECLTEIYKNKPNIEEIGVLMLEDYLQSKMEE